MSLSSYTKVYHLGHRTIANIFENEVVVQEKLDGSQFSFGRVNGELFARSRGKQLDLDAPEKLFRGAVDHVKSVAHLLTDGWVYRGECITSPKHNTLHYDRVPNGCVVLFDVQTRWDDCSHCIIEPIALTAEAKRIGVEPVQFLSHGRFTSAEQLKSLLDNVSQLGGVNIEGFVVKNYHRFTETDGHYMVGKFVSEEFKEKHVKDWKNRHPTKKDVCDKIIDALKTEARWRKAIQHLRDGGELEGSPKDIGKLIPEIGRDTKEEEAEFIRDELFKAYWPTIQRGIIRGAPEWYKEQLLEQSFPTES